MPFQRNNSWKQRGVAIMTDLGHSHNGDNDSLDNMMGGGSQKY